MAPSWADLSLLQRFEAFHIYPPKKKQTTQREMPETEKSAPETYLL